MLLSGKVFDKVYVGENVFSLLQALGDLKRNRRVLMMAMPKEEREKHPSVFPSLSRPLSTLDEWGMRTLKQWAKEVEIDLEESFFLPAPFTLMKKGETLRLGGSVQENGLELLRKLNLSQSKEAIGLIQEIQKDDDNFLKGLEDIFSQVTCNHYNSLAQLKLKKEHLFFQVLFDLLKAHNLELNHWKKGLDFDLGMSAPLRAQSEEDALMWISPRYLLDHHKVQDLLREIFLYRGGHQLVSTLKEVDLKREKEQGLIVIEVQGPEGLFLTRELHNWDEGPYLHPFKRKRKSSMKSLTLSLPFSSQERGDNHEVREWIFFDEKEFSEVWVDGASLLFNVHERQFKLFISGGMAPGEAMRKDHLKLKKILTPYLELYAGLNEKQREDVFQTLFDIKEFDFSHPVLPFFPLKSKQFSTRDLDFYAEGPLSKAKNYSKLKDWTRAGEIGLSLYDLSLLAKSSSHWSSSEFQGQ